LNWILYGVLLLLLFLVQVLWKHEGWLGGCPDLLLAAALGLALFGRPRQSFFLVLPAAALRAGFSLEPAFFVLAGFLLAAFLLQEIRRWVFPERAEIQFGLAFLVAFAFFTLGEFAAGGRAVPWRQAVWSAVLTALFVPLLCGLLRSLPAMRRLLVQR